jgi:RimJ/RimL family protein N-acetyltransferase
MQPTPSPAPAATETLVHDGVHFVLREVRPSDAELIDRGFDALGEESRYQRFFMPKARLSPDELRILTQSDGVRSYVLGLVARDEHGREQPVGVARYVVLADSVDVAEAAVTIVDAMQGRGLGKLLLHRLAHAARLRGVRRFRCTMLSDNVAIHRLLRSLDAHPQLVSREPGSDVYEASLDAFEPVARA